jgi:hypothetical protein
MKYLLRKLFLVLVLLQFFVISCTKTEDKVTREGYRPIYISKDDAYKINSNTARNIQNPGKIYIKDSFIYVMEKGDGIHVIDNSDPGLPELEYFITVPGIKDIAIKNTFLYADNFTDIVVIDIKDHSNVNVVKRIQGVYPLKYQMYPPYDCWFECVDTTKGYVKYWVKTTLNDPKCYTSIEQTALD